MYVSTKEFRRQQSLVSVWFDRQKSASDKSLRVNNFGNQFMRRETGGCLELRSEKGAVIKFVYTYMLSCLGTVKGKNNFSAHMWGQDTIADKTGLSKSAVCLAVKRLVELKLIVKMKIKDQKKWQYWILFLIPPSLRNGLASCKDDKVSKKDTRSTPKQDDAPEETIHQEQVQPAPKNKSKTAAVEACLRDGLVNRKANPGIQWGEHERKKARMLIECYGEQGTMNIILWACKHWDGYIEHNGCRNQPNINVIKGMASTLTDDLTNGTIPGNSKKTAKSRVQDSEWPSDATDLNPDSWGLN